MAGHGQIAGYRQLCCTAAHYHSRDTRLGNSGPGDLVDWHASIDSHVDMLFCPPFVTALRHLDRERNNRIRPLI